ERVISVAYFALINVEKYDPQPLKRYKAAWFPVGSHPELIFDHGDMLAQAKRELKRKAATEPIGFALLPQKFTIPQLQKLYEAMLDTELDRGNFNRRIKASGVLRRLDEKERSGSKKGAFLYVFDRQQYQTLRARGSSINLV
ncbi:MAG: DNA mismatch repair protein MutT, partial [Bacteroidota bacterium]